MSSSERRRLEQEERQERIMQVACEMAREVSWQRVSLRSIAVRMHYTHGMIYKYFKNKEALLRAIWDYGFYVLAENISHNIATAETPITKLHSFALAYWQFAWESSELYAVMFGMDGSSLKIACTNDIRDRKSFIQNLASDIIKTMLIANQVQPDDLDNKAVLLWSSLHGLVSFTMTNTDALTPLNKQDLVICMLNTLLGAWHIPLPSIPDLF